VVSVHWYEGGDGLLLLDLFFFFFWAQACVPCIEGLCYQL
jgi:hypothetical protein